jgi:WbqC-like protein family
MLVAIHQPEYFPWLGYFDKMIRADAFVLLDEAQFSKGDYQNRNHIKGPTGIQWLTIPIIQRRAQNINEVVVAHQHWQAKHWRSLISCYSRAKYFETFSPLFEDFYRQAGVRLIDYTLRALRLTVPLLGIEKNWMLASELRVGGSKSDLVLNICREIGASAYYSGRTGSTYLDREKFRRAGIEIKVQSFVHPLYEQLFMAGLGFIPNLSVLDLLFNCGPDSGNVIRAQNSGG